MSAAGDLIRQEWVEILGPYDELRRVRIGEAFRRLVENLRHLDSRYEEFQQARRACQQWVPGHDTSGPTLDDVQQQLVDKIEAFHQQVYSTLSTLTLVLQRMRDGRTPMYPTDSMTKLLKRLKQDLKANPQWVQDLDILEKSITFRSKYIDHPASNPLFDWYTQGYEGEVYVIFFKHLPPGSPLPGPLAPEEPNPFVLHPRDPNFQPVIECAEFMTAPDEEATYGALQQIVVVAIDQVRASRRTDGESPTTPE
jgi:hypothetical protein